ncbi:MAG: transposase, partial [Elusimicrobiota bacterium]|nr:transposase [Elusimicrobiota bacterium]
FKIKEIICTAICNGKKHDFRLFKEAKIYASSATKYLVDIGFKGLNKIHINTLIPKKKSKKQPLTKEDKKFNKEISSKRIVVENVIGFVKRFKIVSDRYRNRRKRLGLRFNLIASICNCEFDT